MRERPSSIFRKKLAQLNAPDISSVLAEEQKKEVKIKEKNRLLSVYEKEIAPILNNQRRILGNNSIGNHIYKLCKETALSIYDKEDKKRPPFYKPLEIKDYEDLYLVKNKYITETFNKPADLALEFEKSPTFLDQLRVGTKFKFMEEVGHAAYHYAAFEIGLIDNFLVWSFGQRGTSSTFKQSNFLSYEKGGNCRITPKNLERVAEFFAVAVYQRLYAFESYPEQDNEVGVGSMGSG